MTQPDGEAMLAEAMSLVMALQQRVILLAGQVGTLQKQLDEKNNVEPRPVV